MVLKKLLIASCAAALGASFVTANSANADIRDNYTNQQQKAQEENSKICKYYNKAQYSAPGFGTPTRIYISDSDNYEIGVGKGQVVFIHKEHGRRCFWSRFYGGWLGKKIAMGMLAL